MSTPSSPLLTSIPAISGGIPDSSDFAPSILFTVLYVLLFPLIIYRAFQYTTPWTLIFASVRLALFASIRIATFILRAIEAHQTQEGIPSPQIIPFVVEQIFLGIGFIVLATNLVSLVRSHLSREDVARTQGEIALAQRFGFVGTIMILGLLASIVLGIIAGSEYSGAISDPSVAARTKTERLISSILTLVAMGLAALLSAHMLLQHPSLPRTSSAYLLGLACLILVIPAYRISTLASSTNPTVAQLLSTQTKAEFWVLQVTVEWVSLVLLSAVDIRIWFGAGGADAMEAMARTGDVEMQEPGKGGETTQHAAPVGA
ncbi:hypothetical protein CALVIDRAFT_564653 [Calocera viscosa TUFC12733]|uniref:Uncharacterized protein n=1 Tax=Calocera viscosa (strain TUFC12733) TaxID=1330018 RepID=A0A167LEJ4_CALVF|nr:hypothetical protein CALVIDRAFT_564653 [Calocera viscosa TUFC12733]